ncbi:MAG: PaaI family thioesterase [Planctomycetota bacterium]|nr:PaaI family thioesterase [Planctomycetota bacterium]
MTDEAAGMSDIFGWAPISQLIGLEVQPGESGSATVYLNVDGKMHNPMGFVHGGVIALLADAATGIAFGRTLEDQQSFATVEMKTTYIRPVKQGRLCATAGLLQRGLRIGFVECTIVDQRQKLIARASCTCTVNSLSND